MENYEDIINNKDNEEYKKAFNEKYADNHLNEFFGYKAEPFKYALKLAYNHRINTRLMERFNLSPRDRYFDYFQLDKDFNSYTFNKYINDETITYEVKRFKSFRDMMDTIKGVKYHGSYVGPDGKTRKYQLRFHDADYIIAVLKSDPLNNPDGEAIWLIDHLLNARKIEKNI